MSVFKLSCSMGCRLKGIFGNSEVFLVVSVFVLLSLVRFIVNVKYWTELDMWL